MRAAALRSAFDSSVAARQHYFGFTAPAGHGNRWLVARNFGVARPIPGAGRKGWEVDVRPYGRIREIPLDGAKALRLNEELAKHVLESIRSSIANGASEQASVAPYLRTRATVKAKLPAWLEHLRARVEAGERSPSYLREIDRYAGDGGHFEYLADRSIFELRFAHLEDWALWLSKERALSAKTRRNVLGAFSSFLHWLRRRGEIAEVPPFPTVQVARRLPKIISVEAQELVLGEIAQNAVGIFYALAELVVRPGEARALDVSDYSWRNRQLRISHGMDGLSASSKRKSTKELDARVHTASERLSAWLEATTAVEDRLHGDRPLFVNPRTGKRFSYWALRDEWRGAAARAGVPGTKLYEGTKHSTMTALRRKGVPLDVLQRTAGHADPRSTEIYAILADTAVFEALGKRK